jgi:hypothetical protein
MSDPSTFNFSDAGLYATDSLTPMEIHVGDVAGIVHVKRLPVTELRRFHWETQSDDPKVRETAGLSALVRAIRKEDGAPHMTFEQAKKLRGPAVAELMRVFVAVNAEKVDGDLGNG